MYIYVYTIYILHDSSAVAISGAAGASANSPNIL